MQAFKEVKPGAGYYTCDVIVILAQNAGKSWDP